MESKGSTITKKWSRMVIWFQYLFSFHCFCLSLMTSSTFRIGSCCYSVDNLSATPQLQRDWTPSRLDFDTVGDWKQEPTVFQMAVCPHPQIVVLVTEFILIALNSLFVEPMSWHAWQIVTVCSLMIFGHLYCRLGQYHYSAFQTPTVFMKGPVVVAGGAVWKWTAPSWMAEHKKINHAKIDGKQIQSGQLEKWKYVYIFGDMLFVGLSPSPDIWRFDNHMSLKPPTIWVSILFWMLAGGETGQLLVGWFWTSSHALNNLALSAISANQPTVQHRYNRPLKCAISILSA